MAWYKLVFKQNQPIHIGSSKWGVVKETDIFISGQTMWGALTNMYIQKLNHGDLEQAKKLFESISNFFPSFDGENILRPFYKDGEFHLGGFSESKFKAYFVDTLVQTAIEPISRKAKEKSLHEIDYILPKPKKDFQDKITMQHPLYWIGIIKIIDNNIMQIMQKGLKIYIGGDSRYGYGELELITISKDFINEDEKDFWWIENDKFKLKTNKNTPYFIELNDKFSNLIKFYGEIVLLAEMNFLKNIPEVENACYFISVGSKIVSSSENNLSINLELKKGKLIYKEVNHGRNN